MPQMSAQQQAAFSAANRSGQDAGDVNVLVVSILVALMLTWLVWVCLGSYQMLRGPGVRPQDAVLKIGRAVFIALVIMGIATGAWN